mmetsp:Transcript_24850/g.51674  ORF Transcript_24850/g.51674 Transcript_24850/m.51674 type:complete len:222 (-) Transcript_24850:132-797(-)
MPVHQDRSRSRSRSRGLRAALRARADKALAEAKLRAAAKNCASASADAAGPVGTSTGAQMSPISSELAACRDGSFLLRGSKPRQAALWTSAGRAATQGELPAAQGEVPCRFFGSMRGCIRGDACGFSHHEPNSVEMCRFLQRGGCLKAASCSYRHVHWASASEAEAHCAEQGTDSVLEAERAWQELHGHGPDSHMPRTAGSPFVRMLRFMSRLQSATGPLR